MSAYIVPASPPHPIKLYTTCPIPPAVLTAIQQDFDLGAHRGFHEKFELQISDRTDLHGQSPSPECVLRALESEGSFDASGESIEYDAFLVADESSLEDTGHGRFAVWYVDGWQTPGAIHQDELAPGANVQIDDRGRYNFAVKARMRPSSVPTVWLTSFIGEGVTDRLQFPYHPFGPHELDDAGHDWRRSPPLGVSVIADASGYDKMYASELPPGRLLVPGRRMEEIEVYRLKEGIATQLGLVAGWSMGEPFDQSTVKRDAEGWQNVPELDASTCVRFRQNWVWQPPEVPANDQGGA